MDFSALYNDNQQIFASFKQFGEKMLAIFEKSIKDPNSKRMFIDLQCKWNETSEGT